MLGNNIGENSKLSGVSLPVPEIPDNPFEPLEAPERDESYFYNDNDSDYSWEGDWEGWDAQQRINDEAEFAASGLMGREAAEVQQAAAAGWI